MPQQVSLTALLVHDYDDAIDFYVRKLGFELREDKQLSPAKRWVVVAPPGGECGLLLARAVEPRQANAVGNQSGGRVGFFLHTDDFESDFDSYRKNGVHFLETPREESYGKVAVFEDLYGNKWDLLEPANN
jgi:catechol 2,3-dioxygenase-like lactoylglutathione lyase family enzyme